MDVQELRKSVSNAPTRVSGLKEKDDMWRMRGTVTKEWRPGKIYILFNYYPC